MSVNNDFDIIFPVVLTVAVFLLHRFTSPLGPGKANTTGTVMTPNIFLRDRLMGFFLFGIIPAIACLAFYGTAVPVPDDGHLFRSVPSAGVYAALVLIAVLSGTASFLRGLKVPEHSTYPVDPNTGSNGKMMIWSVTGWALYIAGYEYLYRGVLFTLIMNAVGLWPSVAVNIALYSFSHLPNGKGQTVGAIPFGVILCLATALTGNIIFAFIIHLSLALGTSLASQLSMRRPAVEGMTE